MDWNRRFEQVFASGGDASTKGGTLIGAGAHIIGDVISAESVELSGHITGRLVSGNGQKEGTVLIQAKGSLQGQLVGDAVTILGHVQGTVRSAGVLQLGADAQVEADLGYGDLYIQAGAVVKGALSPVVSPTVTEMPHLAKA
jgi:cytoskeletal protein CcmA (bactofilin family)